MIDAKDLRSGNWLKTKPFSITRLGIYSNGYTQITAYGIAMIEENQLEHRYEPIPLTPDILVRLGFEEQPMGYGINVSLFKKGLEYKQLFVDLNQGLAIRQGDTNQSRIKDDLVSVYNIDISGKIMVHTLQNWYRLLTGTELTFNQQ